MVWWVISWESFDLCELSPCHARETS